MRSYLRVQDPSEKSNSDMAPFMNVMRGALWPTSASVRTGTSRCASASVTSSVYPLSPA